MKVDEMAKSNIKKEINTICQTAITVWNNEGEERGDFIEQLDKIVESMVTIYGLETEVLTKYRTMVESAKEMNLAISKKVTLTDTRNLREMIFALCDNLSEPKQIMEYVRTACELVDVWDERLKR